MKFTDYLNIAASIIASVGGSSVLIIVLSSWLGKVWANRILEKDKIKYKSELEKVINSYDKELEKYKNQLEKSKALFLRYSEYQFTLYNELWKSLSDLKIMATMLWIKADLKNLISFARQLLDTQISVERNRLLIEEKHYKSLLKILDTFSDYQIGKDSLIKLRNYKVHNLKKRITNEVIKKIIRDNKRTKETYTELLEKLVKDFRKQITRGV